EYSPGHYARNRVPMPSACGHARALGDRAACRLRAAVALWLKWCFSHVAGSPPRVLRRILRHVDHRSVFHLVSYSRASTLALADFSITSIAAQLLSLLGDYLHVRLARIAHYDHV